MREIVEGVVTWPWFSEPHGYDFNGYFVRHPTGNLCIDPVEPSDEVLALFAREGVARILVNRRVVAPTGPAPTRPQDRTAKAAIYATAGIPDYWIVDVRDDRAEIHRQPTAGAHGEVRVATAGEQLAVVALPGTMIAAHILLPRR